MGIKVFDDMFRDIESYILSLKPRDLDNEYRSPDIKIITEKLPEVVSSFNDKHQGIYPHMKVSIPENIQEIGKRMKEDSHVAAR